MEPHVCPDCEHFYRPRHAREAERCAWCVGLTIREHVAAVRQANGEEPEARREQRPAESNGSRPEYLQRIEALLK